MTISEEKELEQVKSGLTYIGGDHHSKNPHFHASYPWVEDPATLPNNRKAVEALFRRTEKQLAKKPQWKAAYKAQVHEMIERNAAVKLSKMEVASWSGPVWYIKTLNCTKPLLCNYAGPPCLEQQSKIQRSAPQEPRRPQQHPCRPPPVLPRCLCCTRRHQDDVQLCVA